MPREKRHSKHIEKKGGRPKGKNIIKIDWDMVANMVQAGCNGQQCAATIGCHPDTLYERCVQEQNAVWTAWMTEKRAHGDAKLLAAQYHKALKERHPSMLIWLGKNRLKQSDAPLDENAQQHAAVDAIAALAKIAQQLDPQVIQALSQLDQEAQNELIASAQRKATESTRKPE